MPKLIMLCGIPASGKSELTQKLSDQYHAIIYASDSLRKELYGDENTNDKNEEVFKELHSRIKRSLISGESVIYDATNTNYKRRRAFVEELNRYNCEKVCCIVATPYEQCLRQNDSRIRKVPQSVIKKMYMNFYIPQYYEGWDDIKFVWNFDESQFKRDDLFNELNGFHQDNPHHTLTLGEHCNLCAYLVMKSVESKEAFEIFMAARFHDIGKKFTKTFTNFKGENSDIAHYYQHHLVGAYDSMFYLKSSGFDDKDILNICNYIQWHMQPYFIETDKAKTKFINLVGKEFYDNLMVLHEADKNAH